MGFLKTVYPLEPGPTLAVENLLLKPPQMSDYPAWSKLRGDSRAFLAQWEPLWSDDELSRAAFRRRLRYYQREGDEETGYAFFLHRVHDNALMGGVTLSNVRRGVSQSCAVGYWMGEQYAGQGHMCKAMQSVISFVFDTLKLHRLEAASMPANLPSIRLLNRLGFTREGLARGNLRINGAWEDHLLFALLSGDRRA
ncbi:MAG: GNAT family protein [Hyphomicrobiales bacterium]|nr:GNAT family protein [Hyphomicrobiales bacterium]